jgi:hypothetical protein
MAPPFKFFNALHAKELSHSMLLHPDSQKGCLDSISKKYPLELQSLTGIL